MELLENLYEKPPLFSNFFGRRYHISHQKTILRGMHKSGTSSIIVDFLGTLEEGSFLYVNLSDARVDVNKLENLQSFISANSISYLIIENYTIGFPIPDVENIVLSSCEKNLSIEGFETLDVAPLCFEEFVGAGQRFFDTEHLFNLYANLGRLPHSYNLNKSENKRYLQDVAKLLCEDSLKFELFRHFAKNQSQTVSLHKAYQELKLHHKLSKDKLYKISHELENEHIISFISKLGFPKSAKKIYLTDFAFKNTLTYEKDFVKRFENMVFCELSGEIFYTDEIHFYIPMRNLAILAIPFLPYELIIGRFKKLNQKLKSLNIEHLHVISLGASGEFEQNGIKCEVMPFWDWALSL